MLLLSISLENYQSAVIEGRLQLSIGNFEDPMDRFRWHNLWDMSLYWLSEALNEPSRGISIGSNRIEEIVDALAVELELELELERKTVSELIDRVYVLFSQPNEFIEFFASTDHEFDVLSDLLSVYPHFVFKVLEFISPGNV